MKNYLISINQMAEFYDASDSVKKRIISQQLKPSKFRISWYQLPKARIKKSIELKGDLNPIYDGIKTLLNRKPDTKRKLTDRNVSLQAMERFIKMKLPSILNDIEYTTIKPKVKSTRISDVEVLVAPDVIVQGELNGKTVIGGVKIHISKNKPFDLKKSKIVASMISKFLKQEVVENESEVLPELCFCLDVFNESIVSAKDNDSIFKDINKICDEIKRLWNAA